MKKKNIFVALLGTLVFSGALGVSLVAPTPVKEAKAEVPAEYEIIVNVGKDLGWGHWSDGSAKFAIWYWSQTNTGKWTDDFLSAYSAGSVGVDGPLYTVTLPSADVEHIIVTRYSPECAAPTWDEGTTKMWDKTANIDYPTDSNGCDIFEINGGGDKARTAEHHKIYEPVRNKFLLYHEVTSAFMEGGATTGFPNVYPYEPYVKSTYAWPGTGSNLVRDNLYLQEFSKSYRHFVINNGADTDTAMKKTVDFVLPGYLVNRPANGIITKVVVGDLSGDKYSVSIAERQAATLVPLSTMRIWLDRSALYESGYTIGLHFYDDSLDYEYYPSGYAEFETNHWLVYYDVDTDYVGRNIQFKVYPDNLLTDCVKATQEGAVYTTGDNAKVFRLKDTAGVLSYERQAFTSTSKAYAASKLAKVFEGYLTCTSNKDNGYGAFSELVLTWIRNEYVYDSDTIWFIDGLMSEVAIKDFETTDTSYSHDRTSDFWLQDKVNMMSSLYDSSTSGSYSFFTNDNASLTITLVMISIVAISGIAIIAVLKKKRTN